MAALTGANPKLVKSDNPMETLEVTILNGQSWKGGQFLFRDANGYIKTCASDADASTGGIKYQALADQADPAATTTRVDVGVITEDMVFEGNELDGAVTIANIDVPYGIDVTNNLVSVDVDDTGNDAVTIVELGPEYNPAKYVAADTLAKVRFSILPAALEAANV